MYFIYDWIQNSIFILATHSGKTRDVKFRFF